MVASNGPTELQQRILETANRNPNRSKEWIADRCGCRKGHVTKTLNEYGDPKDDGYIFGPGY